MNTRCMYGVAAALALSAAVTLFAQSPAGGAQVYRARLRRKPKPAYVEVLADQFEGKRLNIPNDLVVDGEGRVWFTDPYYEGAAGPWSRDRGPKELEHDSVYRLDRKAAGPRRPRQLQPQQRRRIDVSIPMERRQGRWRWQPDRIG